MRWAGVEWLHLAQDGVKWRDLMNMIMKLRVPYMEGNLLTIGDTVSFSETTLCHGVT